MALCLNSCGHKKLFKQLNFNLLKISLNTLGNNKYYSAVAKPIQTLKNP